MVQGCCRQTEMRAVQSCANGAPAEGTVDLCQIRLQEDFAEELVQFVDGG